MKQSKLSFKTVDKENVPPKAASDQPCVNSLKRSMITQENGPDKDGQASQEKSQKIEDCHVVVLKDEKPTEEKKEEKRSRSSSPKSKVKSNSKQNPESKKKKSRSISPNPRSKVPNKEELEKRRQRIEAQKEEQRLRGLLQFVIFFFIF